MRRLLTFSLLIVSYTLSNAFVLGHRFGVSSGTGGAPVAVTAPVVTGSTSPGSTLTTSNGVWSGSPTSYSYEWDQAPANVGPWTPISGATSNTYVTSSNTGVFYSTIVTATNTIGSTISSRSNAFGPMTIPSGGSPQIVGNPTVTQGAPTQPTLTVTDGSANCSLNVCAYQWFNNGTQVPGANSNSFTLLSTYTSSNVIQATVLENTPSGSFVSVNSSNQVIVKYSRQIAGNTSYTPPYLTIGGSPPSLSNYTSIGATLTINDGVYDPPSLVGSQYSWGREGNSTGGNWETVCQPGTGVTGSCVPVTTQTYTLQDCNGGTTPNCKSDVGYIIRGGQYTQNFGGISYFTLPVGVITEPTSLPSPLAATSSLRLGGNNTPYIGYTLTAVPFVNGANPPSWNNFVSPQGPFSYQWYSCTGSTCANTPPTGGTPISGATNGYYVLTSSDLGNQIYASITYTDSTGTASGYSPATLPISMPPSPINTVPPSITGLPAYGNVGAGNYGSLLYTTTGTWQNNPSLFTYQWYQGTPPDKSHPATGLGATTNTYTVASSDLGQTLWVEVMGRTLVNAVAADSIATAQVASIAAPSPLTGAALNVYPPNRDSLNMAGCTPAPTTYTNTWYVDSSAGSTPISQYGGATINGGVAGTADGTSAHPFNSLIAMLQGSKNTVFAGQPGYIRPLISTVVYNHQFASSSDPNPLPWAATFPGVGAHGLATDSDWNPPGSPQPTGSLVAPGFTPTGAAFVVDSNRINPGDRILVRNANSPAKSMSLSGTNTDLTDGLTNWITIAADTGYTPVVSGFNSSGFTQGYDIEGIKVKAVPLPVAPLTGSTLGGAYNPLMFTLNSTKDIIFNNGIIENYDSLSEVETDYANDCTNTGHGACNATNIGNYLFYTLKRGIMIGSTASPVKANSSSCVAVTNSTIRWVYGGLLVAFSKNILFENNDLGYWAADAVDFYTDTTILHKNFIHDPLSLGDGVHNDVFQNQRIGTDNYAYYGLTIDSNRIVSKVDSNLASVTDPLGPGGFTSLANEASCYQTSYGYYTSTMFTNNVCNMPIIWHISGEYLGTFVNNSFVDNGAAGTASPSDSGNFATYWANNVFSTALGVGIDCQHNLWTHNVGAPTGGHTVGASASTGTSCTPTDAMFHVDPLPGSSFVANSPNSSGYNTSANQDLTPLTSGALDGTGVAGNGAPTVNVCSTYNISSVCATQSTRTSPPSIGAY